MIGVIPSHPQLGDWRRVLVAPLSDVFGESCEVSLLCPPKNVADDTLKLLARDLWGRPKGVVLCSSCTDPNSVAVGMEHARQAKGALSEDMREAVLEPLLEGRNFGLSYAVMPYCESLSKSRVLNRVQRMALAPALFRWLRRCSRVTTSDPAPPGGDPGIVAALTSLEMTREMPHGVRAAAGKALDRLDSGLWVPRRVLMHGDFGLGNVLIRPAGSLNALRKPWWSRFVIIDWAGSRNDGFAFWDLFRLAHSLGTSNRRLAAQVDVWTRGLGCSAMDVRSYVAAALGDLGLHLNHFPFDRYVELADTVMRDVDLILDLK